VLLEIALPTNEPEATGSSDGSNAFHWSIAEVRINKNREVACSLFNLLERELG